MEEILKKLEKIESALEFIMHVENYRHWDEEEKDWVPNIDHR